MRTSSELWKPHSRPSAWGVRHAALRWSKSLAQSGLSDQDESMIDESARPTIHQHPLAYLLGLEGVALMRAFAGEYDRAFTDARIAEVGWLLERADDLGPGIDVGPLSMPDGYDGWAMTYDAEDNGCFPMRDD